MILYSRCVLPKKASYSKKTQRQRGLKRYKRVGLWFPKLHKTMRSRA